METIVSILILLGAIALGALVLHLLNSQRDERIANHYYTPSRRRYTPSRRRRKDDGKAGRPASKGPPSDGR